ncbi:hypothetical protein SAMN05444344_0381 [Tenacibaculum mesophilum]|uniref:Plasminogen-binding protein PgbA N-terminal domain-containing protein n=1 Tax=Tenacibaculum mesophilum TaxID=104268 RepID=A0ABM7CJ04_9FLAO|nr:hypothetical protein [Tenacibaculum mesophilum]AZJ33792.1 hypothetical protein D6200_14945 [Tenacibaculum mesophilum]QFS29034.1 hypothetical protein F9Y86_11750 [Tenacibaculum mesophilum]SHF53600.1 hypothetical protein SAMN05444344_0381 [Tenacibaculum mesophilum]
MIKKVFLIFFCVFSSLGYSQNYIIFQNNFISFRQPLPDNFNLVKNEIPAEINIFLIEDKVNVPVLTSIHVRDDKFINRKKKIASLKSIHGEQRIDKVYSYLKSIPSRGNAFVHGRKKIKNNLFLYLYSKEFRGLTEGFLLLANSNCILGYVKVFESMNENPYFFKTYLIDNNIVNVLVYDDGYDIDDGTGDSKYSYSVLYISEKGVITNLDKEKLIKVLKKNKKYIN